MAFFPKVFLPIQSHNRAAMQTNSHAHTSTDLHSHLCVGIANTNTGTQPFSDLKTPRGYEIQSAHNPNAPAISALKLLVLQSISVRCNIYAFCSFYPLGWLVWPSFGPTHRTHVLIQNCSGKMVQLGAISGIVCIKIHMPELRLKCRWHTNWQKLRKGPTTSTKNIATTIGEKKRISNILAAGVVQLLSGKCRPELNQPAEVEMLGVEIQMNNLHAQLSSTQNNLGPNQVTVPRLHSHNIWSAFRQ